MCKKQGHIKRDCPEKNKENAKSKKGSSKSVNILDEDSESSDSDMFSILSDHLTDSLILDSAYSYHMITNNDWFHTI